MQDTNHVPPLPLIGKEPSNVVCIKSNSYGAINIVLNPVSKFLNNKIKINEKKYNGYKVISRLFIKVNNLLLSEKSYS